MHFQIPPFAYVKIVNVLQGAVLDVVVDIRQNSTTYKKYFAITLCENDGRFLYIPKGFAHGFKVLNNSAIVEYNQTTEYNNDCDCGIRWDSFGYNWELENPIMSERDKSLPLLNEYLTPF
jgi:dTDP-4-dehydrorhamnose 3,5-epimerase